MKIEVIHHASIKLIDDKIFYFDPYNIKEKPQEGTVVAVGPGKKDEPMTLKVGDRVLYSKYGGTEFKEGDTTYLIMRESDVYAII